MPRILRVMKRIIKNPRDGFLYLPYIAGYFKFMSDPAYLKYMYWAHTGKKLNLKNPKGFNEKLQWLKVYDHNTDYTMMTDKFLVRDYVSKKIGSEYLIPILGVWEHATDIDFSSLPNEFVLKCNHNSGGGMCICRNKSKLNLEKIVGELDRNLKINYYWARREWSYKNIRPKIVAEQFMNDNDPQNTEKTLIDYKFYCFNGEPKFLYVGIDDVSSGTKGELKLSLLDLNWKPVPFYRADHKEMPFLPSKPDCLVEMVQLAKKLAENIPFVRVDMYYINRKIYFSEMTFYPGGGFSFFSPMEWEKRIGDWIQLPTTDS